jgi:hypothetical protein
MLSCGAFHGTVLLFLLYTYVCNTPVTVARLAEWWAGLTMLCMRAQQKGDLLTQDLLLHINHELRPSS